MSIKEFLKLVLYNGFEYFGVYYSHYPSIVASIDDPDKRGRVKVKNRGLFGTSVSDWCEPTGMWSGKDMGFFASPQVGDIVYLSFASGNIQYPRYSYGCWAKGELPTEATDNYGKVDVIKTKAGLLLIFDNDEESIKIVHPNGLEIELKDGLVKLGTDDHVAVLGDILKPELDALKFNVDLVYNAIQNGITVPQDGGASYKATMAAILAAKQAVDFSDINSDTVKLK